MTSITVHSDRCSGCRACLLACSSAHEDGFSPRRARLRVLKDDIGAQDRPILCRHCADPDCVEACPTGALTQVEGGGLELEEGLCVACGLCIAACPYQALCTHPKSARPMPCDLCGGAPACVRACVLGALMEER